MRLVAVDLGDDIDVRKVVEKFGSTPPASWEDPIVISHSTGDLYLYSFGALTGIDVPQAAVMDVAESLLSFTESGKIGSYEELTLQEGSGNEEEVIYTRNLDSLAIKVASFALAQSVALSRMEKIMDEIEEEVERVLTEGKRFLGRRALKVAKKLMRIRHQLISDIMILEKPSLAWEEERLDDLYERVSKYLELGRRYRVMEKRLESSFETIQVLLSISSESRGNLLELLIVILILVEILLWFIELI